MLSLFAELSSSIAGIFPIHPGPSSSRLKANVQSVHEGDDVHFILELRLKDFIRRVGGWMTLCYATFIESLQLELECALYFYIVFVTLFTPKLPTSSSYTGLCGLCSDLTSAKPCLQQLFSQLSCSQSRGISTSFASSHDCS